jgi:hypothetical protein
LRCGDPVRLAVVRSPRVTERRRMLAALAALGVLSACSAGQHGAAPAAVAAPVGRSSVGVTAADPVPATASAPAPPPAAVSLDPYRSCPRLRPTDGRAPGDVLAGVSARSLSVDQRWLALLGERSGRLTQTLVRPTVDCVLRARLAELVRSVATRTPGPARDAFFPSTAYAQVKAIADPAADYRQRLLALYDADVAVLQPEIPPGAHLAGVRVPNDAIWVPPGAEFNRLGYWRVYGTQVSYSAAGRTATLTICSMISWRGDFYVVHLGPVLRNGTGQGELCR